jgi:hypothetical protein
LSVEDYGSSDETPIEGSEEGSGEPLTLRIVDASSGESPDEERTLKRKAIENLIRMRYPLDPKIESAIELGNRTHVGGSYAKSTKPLIEENNRRGFTQTFDAATIEAEMKRIRPSLTTGRKII